MIYFNSGLWIFCSFLLTCIPFLLLSQDTPLEIYRNEAELFNYTEKIYGSNDLLVNGQIYIPTKSQALGHPYFNSNDWANGMLFIAGNLFPDVVLKYDIEQDVFVLKNKNRKGGNQYISLQKGLVDTVEIEGHLFINSALILPESRNLGYVELIFRGDFLFFIKYVKQYKKVYSDTKPYGEYTRQQSVHYIYQDGRIDKLPTKKAFISHFAEHKKAIKKYFKKNKIKYNNASPRQVRKLLTYCNDLQKQ
ncbi:MAG: hypothetical protein K8S16_10125 [Bacteroidales bacterium]|nr:hypothetical protein [Bacteroidales bacterium]